jgi:predicted nucleotide-binding protein
MQCGRPSNPPSQKTPTWLYLTKTFVDRAQAELPGPSARHLDNVEDIYRFHLGYRVARGFAGPGSLLFLDPPQPFPTGPAPGRLSFWLFDSSIPRPNQEGRQLLEEHEPTSAHMAFEGWVSSVGRWLTQISAGLSAQWLGMPSSRLVIAGEYYNDAGSWRNFKDTVSHRLKWLGDVLVTIEAKKEKARTGAVKLELSDEIFIVHGHDGELKEATARLVSTLGLQPVILHEQTNKGRTIIEKFSDHAQAAGFAIVLLSADDIGGPKQASRLNPRARQNVILELGYFFGALGRDRVCAVYEEGVERPSDLDGLVYVKYDKEGSWKYQVGKEIRAAGYEADLNKL